MPPAAATLAAAGECPTDDVFIDHAIDRLAATPTGREFAALLRERRDRIVVLAEAGGVLPAGAGARWDPRSQQMFVLRSQLPELGFEALLAHEASHMRDNPGPLRYAGFALQSIGHAAFDMAVAPLRRQNPVTAGIDELFSRFQTEGEVGAYHVEAKVAHELGLHADFLQHPDHTPRSREELREWLGSQALYQQPPLVRGVVGFGLAGVLGFASGDVVNKLLRHVAPQTWAGAHPGVITAAGLALGAGLLVQDQLAMRAKRREAAAQSADDPNTAPAPQPLPEPATPCLELDAAAAPARS